MYVARKNETKKLFELGDDFGSGDGYFTVIFFPYKKYSFSVSHVAPGFLVFVEGRWVGFLDSKIPWPWDS